MCFAEISNPFSDPWNGVWAVITITVTWLASKGVDKLLKWTKESGKLWDERVASGMKRKQDEKKLDIEERIELQRLESLEEAQVVKGWQDLLAQCSREKEAIVSRYVTELDNILSEMKAIRAEHKMEMTALRKQHEMCIEEHAVAKTEREAVKKECEMFKSSLAQLNQKYENLKRRVGGSDFTEIVPEKKSE